MKASDFGLPSFALVVTSSILVFVTYQALFFSEEAVGVDNEDIYKLGAKMYYQEHGKYQNPYPIGSPEYNQFERGWMQSLKRDGGRLAQSKFSSTSNEFEFASKHKNSSNVDIRAALYRSRKG